MASELLQKVLQAHGVNRYLGCFFFVTLPVDLVGAPFTDLVRGGGRCIGRTPSLRGRAELLGVGSVTG